MNKKIEEIKKGYDEWYKLTCLPAPLPKRAHNLALELLNHIPFLIASHERLEKEITEADQMIKYLKQETSSLANKEIKLQRVVSCAKGINFDYLISRTAVCKNEFEKIQHGKVKLLQQALEDSK